MSGFFVTFEGIDGAGKSTQIEILAKKLKIFDQKIVITREPGGTKGADQIRQLLVEGDTQRWSAETEILLFTAARRDHMEHIIRPALDAGAILLCDRFVDSTRIYQGTVRSNALRVHIDELHAQMIGYEADLTFVLDINPEYAQKRTTARKSNEQRFERFGINFQQKLRREFIALAQDNPQRCHLINANQQKEQVAENIFTIIQPFLRDINNA